MYVSAADTSIGDLHNDIVPVSNSRQINLYQWQCFLTAVKLQSFHLWLGKSFFTYNIADYQHIYNTQPIGTCLNQVPVIKKHWYCTNILTYIQNLYCHVIQLGENQRVFISWWHETKDLIQILGPTMKQVYLR